MRRAGGSGGAAGPGGEWGPSSGRGAERPQRRRAAPEARKGARQPPRPERMDAGAPRRRPEGGGWDRGEEAKPAVGKVAFLLAAGSSGSGLPVGVLREGSSRGRSEIELYLCLSGL